MTDQPKRATVWWIDAHHGGEQYATLEELANEHKPMLRSDTAWLILDDAVGVTIALSRLVKDGGDTYLKRPAGTSDVVDVMFIPRAMIERVEYLTPEA